MKKNQNQAADYKPEKASFKRYLQMFKGIKMPWLFIIMIFVCTIGTTVAALSVTYFTGDVVGRKPIYRLLHHYNSLSNKMEKNLTGCKLSNP